MQSRLDIVRGGEDKEIVVDSSRQTQGVVRDLASACISAQSVPRPKLGHVPYGKGISTGTVPGTLALTFDDGPYSFTSQILDILDELDAKATFFISGANLAKGQIDDPSMPWPDLLRRMHAAGHHIASHTWTHPNLNEVDSVRLKQEVTFNEKAFSNVLGLIPTYFRAPYLECNATCLDFLDALGYHVIGCNLDTEDYNNNNVGRIHMSKELFSAGVSMDSSSHSYIVLAHDVYEHTVLSLTRYMVKTTRDRGYRLVTVGESLQDPRENWYYKAPAGAS